MPPEQLLNRELTQASDLYSLGVTLLCLLTGTRSRDVGQLINENYGINFKKLPQQGRVLERWLMEMTAPQGVDRYLDARSALYALRQVDLSATGRLWQIIPAFSIHLPKVRSVLVVAVLATIINFSLAAWNLLKQPQATSSQQPAYYELLNQANLLVDRQQYEAAFASYEKATQLNPKQVEVWYRKGLVLTYLRRHQEALDCFEAALQPGMEWGTFPAEQVWWKKGLTLARLHRNAEAILDYDRALQINPNLPEAQVERQVLGQGNVWFNP
ncbi:MAG: tetratricopeptide repeat protein [Stenomitos rutilans HA7619-LM2]|nr:tetratricopeptide repeat protein [Stenomitos rutilans HA7619-LM2]